MKLFTIFLTTFIIFSGCSTKNAFDEFNMSKEEELGYSYLKSSKISSKDNDISGVVSVIYLNGVYPKRFGSNEYFYISYFTKKPKELFDANQPEDTMLKITLNSKEPIKVEKLPEDNEFSGLLDSKNEWSRYYIVEFEKADTLDLLIEDGKEHFASLRYKKE